MVDTERYVVLEITSKRIRMLVGFFLDGKVYVLNKFETKCTGMKEGMIVDIDEVYNSFMPLKAQAESVCGFTIKSVSLIIPPLAMESFNNKGRTGTISNDGIINSVDINNALHLAKDFTLSPGLEIIDSVPISYKLENNEKYSLPPIGKVSSSLTVIAKIYAVPKNLLQSFKDLFFKINVKIDNFLTTPFASAQYLAINEKNFDNYFILNIGEEITSLSYIKNRVEVSNSISYRFGSQSINEALESKLMLMKNDAEHYKLIYGLDENPKFDFNLEKGITLSILRKEIIDVLNPIITKVVKEIEKCSINENQSLSLYLLGGGSKLKGLSSYLSGFGIESYIPESFTLGARDTCWFPLLGAICYVAKKNVLSEKKDEIKKSDFGLVRMK